MNYDVLHRGEIYDPGIPEFMEEQGRLMDKMYEFNHTPPSNTARLSELLAGMLAEFGKNSYIQPPFYANWGGKHLHIGEGVYINFCFTAVDDTHIYIGDHTMLGPNVTVAAAAHPIDPALRRKGLQYNKPVHIGSNCWIGSGALIMPGVTIGDNSIIGAGSVVTRDIPANVVAFGNPCRVQREIEA